MLCEETRSVFSTYLDDVISLPLRAAVDVHLCSCPVCRAHLSELRSLRQGLRVLSTPVPPRDLTASICEALAIEAAARRLYPRLSFSVRLGHWLQPKLMPHTVGPLLQLFFSLACLAPSGRIS
jgi:anti-sigma factor RsiW